MLFEALFIKKNIGTLIGAPSKTLTDVTEKPERLNSYFDFVVSIKKNNLQTGEGRAGLRGNSSPR